MYVRRIIKNIRIILDVKPKSISVNPTKNNNEHLYG
jgi:hypothetical protein